MSYSITQFQNSPGPDQLSALDNNFSTLSAADTISCAIAGTNTLTLTQNAAGLVPSSTLSAYTNYMLFTGIASATNTGAVTATVGSIGALNVYKDTPSGPALLTGNEIVVTNAISLRYDSALNSGAGGFHLIASTENVSVAISPASVQVNGGATLTNWLTGNSPTLTFTATPGLSAQAQTFTLTALAAAAAASLPAPGDFLAVSPSSVAAVGVSYQAYVGSLASLNSTTSVVTVTIQLSNLASASLASNSGIYRWKAERFAP